jgi:phosphoglycerate dehydrogenase-like enzyme
VALFPEASIKKMQEADPRARIIYDDELMSEPRYLADRVGKPMEWNDELESRWREYAAEAEVILGFDRRHLADYTELAPNLKWIQGTSTALGPVTKRMGWVDQGITVTSASGVHSVPIAEFQLMSMLSFTKDIFHLFDLKQQRKYERYNTGQLRGKTVGIVGLGKNGREVARLCRAHGMRVLGVKRVFEGANPSVLGVDRLYPKEQIKDMFAECDFVSLTVPTTDETYKFMDYDMFKAMKPGCVVINNSMGTTAVQDDLLRALEEGHLGGAALDVFEEEPVPEDNPLWDMDNVLFSPHSASCAEFEDANMTDLFIANLHRYLEGMPMLNVIDPELQY